MDARGEADEMDDVRTERGLSIADRRPGGELALAAALPPALALLGPLVVVGGRLSPLVPVAAFPLIMGVKGLWKGLNGGQNGLFGGLKESFGRVWGPVFAAFYLVWGHFLLWVAAERYARRLSAALGEGRWLYLAAALALALWLGQGGRPLLARGVRALLLCALAALALALLVALPGVERRNLRPVERADLVGFLPAVALVVSLSGWAVFALAIPGGREEETAPSRTWTWMAVGCGILALLLLAAVGCFGPALVERMDDPFLYLLEGVRVPGAFRRGEAALCALLIPGELALQALLVRGCAALWEGLAPRMGGRGAGLTAAAMFLLAGWVEGGPMTGNLLFCGGLLFGAGLPGLAFLLRRARGGSEGRAHLVWKKAPDRQDIAARKEIKKS